MQKFLNNPSSVDDCINYLNILRNTDFTSPQIWENMNNDYKKWREENPDAGKDIF